MAEIVMLYHQVAIYIAAYAKSAQVQEVIACRGQSNSTALVIRASQDEWNRDDAFFQYFTLAVDISQQVFERAKSLLESAHNPVPFVGGEYLRQEIAKPAVMVLARWKF